MADAVEITQLLVAARDGDANAKNALFPALYRDLENIAKAHVRSGASLEPRGLVHELYLRLTDATLEARDRKHFYAIAALAMRQILVDRARKRKSQKRGGDAERVTLSQLASDDTAVDVVDVDRALEKLERISERQARIVELRCLVGLTVEETAEALEISERTVAAEWKKARDFLAIELAVEEVATGGLQVGKAEHAFRRRTAVPLDEVDIPGYAIRSTLGEGGMGTVYGAVDAKTQEPVAIKVLQVVADEALARFKAEASIMEKLHHPGIARVLSAGDARSRPYIVMEHVEGTTLDAYIARENPPRLARLVLFTAVCDAIEYAHRAGVVHRDLKPANIMVRPDGDVTILDFGVARAPGSSRTQAGDILGTPLYTSPEQAMGRSKDVDARTDVYSLGVILYELIAGRPPYELKGLNLPAAVRAICEAVPPPLDDEVDAIAQRALAKKPADRFASAAELAAALRRIS